MNQPKLQSGSTASKRTWPLTCIICSSIVILAIFFLLSKPQPLQPGQVVDTLGDYKCPNGRQTLRIKKDDSGNIHISVSRRATLFSIIPYSYWDRSATFESERDWFASVDQYDRLWIYQGHWDKRWGRLREMPSGGTIPYAPAVLMEGISFTSSGELVTGGNVVTATGNWAGVPQQFFDRIPKRSSAQLSSDQEFPTTPPRFTREQHSQVIRLLPSAS
jgi:hypothetical protein